MLPALRDTARTYEKIAGLATVISRLQNKSVGLAAAKGAAIGAPIGGGMGAAGGGVLGIVADAIGHILTFGRRRGSSAYRDASAYYGARGAAGGAAGGAGIGTINALLHNAKARKLRRTLLAGGTAGGLGAGGLAALLLAKKKNGSRR